MGIKINPNKVTKVNNPVNKEECRHNKTPSIVAAILSTKMTANRGNFRSNYKANER